MVLEQEEMVVSKKEELVPAQRRKSTTEESTRKSHAHSPSQLYAPTKTSSNEINNNRAITVTASLSTTSRPKQNGSVAFFKSLY